jgi:hypothetical protein
MLARTKLIAKDILYTHGGRRGAAVSENPTPRYSIYYMHHDVVSLFLASKQTIHRTTTIHSMHRKPCETTIHPSQDKEKANK